MGTKYPVIHKGLNPETTMKVIVVNLTQQWLASLYRKVGGSKVLLVADFKLPLWGF